MKLLKSTGEFLSIGHLNTPTVLRTRRPTEPKTPQCDPHLSLLLFSKLLDFIYMFFKCLKSCHWIYIGQKSVILTFCQVFSSWCNKGQQSQWHHQWFTAIVTSQSSRALCSKFAEAGTGALQSNYLASLKTTVIAKYNLQEIWNDLPNKLNAQTIIIYFEKTIIQPLKLLKIISENDCWLHLVGKNEIIKLIFQSIYYDLDQLRPLTWCFNLSSGL
jgi:hypothetical protein